MEVPLQKPYLSIRNSETIHGADHFLRDINPPAMKYLHLPELQPDDYNPNLSRHQGYLDPWIACEISRNQEVQNPAVIPQPTEKTRYYSHAGKFYLIKIELVWHQAGHFHRHQRRQEWEPPRSLPRYTPIRTGF